MYLKKNNFMFDFKLKSFKIHKETLAKILKIGFPSAIQNVVTSLSFMVINVLVNGYGVDASAAAGIVGKFNSFAIMPASAMSSTTNQRIFFPNDPDFFFGASGTFPPSGS